MKTIKIYFYLLAISLLTINTFAQDGTLDPTFGIGGIVEIEQGSSVISQHKSLPNNQSLILTRRGSLLKINEDGSLDNTFGDNGVVNLKDIVGSHDSLTSQFNDFDFTSTGEIVIGGASYLVDSIGIFLVVVKLNENGDVNRDFGDNGAIKIFVQNNTGNAQIFIGNGKVAITQNDKIIVTKVEYEANPPLYVRLIRLNSNGTIDNSFGTDGSFTNKYRYTIYENRLQMDIDGNIFYGEGFNIAKVLETGILDTTFGNSGYFSYNNLRVYDIDFQSDGKIIGTFRSYSDGYYPVIGRLSQNGLIDSSFALNGFMIIPVNTDDAILRNSIITNEDDIISAGYTYTYTYDSDFSSTYSILTKLSHNGNFIEDFGDSGKVEIALYPDGKEYPEGLFINPENYNITISATREQTDSTYSILLARFNNSKTLSNIHVLGDVSGTWHPGTVFVDGDISVPPNQSLTIKPGTNVYFTGEYKFDVRGQLIANGTSADSIFFFSDSLGMDENYNRLGHWYGLGFINTDAYQSPKSELSYSEFKYARSKAFNSYDDPFGYKTDSIGAPLRLYYSSNVSISNISITECYNKYNINLVHSSPTLNNFTLKDNYQVYLSESSRATLKNIRFETGKLIIGDSNPIMDSLSFVGCYGPLIGRNLGGTISNSVFIDNFYSWKDGGGAFALDKGSTIKFENVLFENNNNSYSDGYYGYGGAGFIRDSSPEFINCEFIGNTAYGSGSAIGLASNDYSHPWVSTFKNCLFVKNKAINNQGTLMSSTNAHLTLINCTIADNTAPYVAGIANDSGTPNIITNSIIYGNGPNFDQQFSTHQSAHQVNYNIIQGSYYGIDENTNNLLDVNPLFRDTSVNDYHLQSVDCGYAENSPGIDAGSPEIDDLLLDCGTAGLGERRSDIGAYGGADNWWDKSVLPSCHFSGDVSGVWECETIYIDGDILIPFGDTLKITDAVEKVLISGPYQITVEGVLLAIGPEDVPPALTGGQILFQGSDWKGIVFKNLNDTNPGTSIIENCRFDYAIKFGSDSENGGAIEIINSDKVILRGSVFYLNQAKFGGAIYVENSNAHIENCYFDLNGKERGQTGEASATAGGAVYIKNSTPYLHKLKFISNQSINGGAALVLDNSSPTIANIMMVRNFTKGSGGAMQLLNGASPNIVNMTTADNVADLSSGALSLSSSSTVSIINSILFEDTKPEISLNGGTLSVTYSIIDSAASETYFGEGCSETDPYLTSDVDYRLSNNTCSYSGGNNVVSPAIDAGHPDSLDTELDCYAGLGEARADMGYYGGRFSETTVGVKDIKFESRNIPNEYVLMQNYPNPFNPSTTIQFALPKAGMVSLKVYNILGEEVVELINEQINAGFQKINFDASHLSSGLYLYRISADNFVDVKKMLLLK